MPNETVDRRFSGVDRLFGRDAAHSIRSAHVAIVGIGGVGSWSAEALARSGVAHLTLVDLDHVSESNVNRQIHATRDTLGMAKVDAMRQRIHAINPDCVVTSRDVFADQGNWPDILPRSVDAVIDACDQTSAKILMAQWALKSPHIAYVCVGAAGGKRQAYRVDVADLSEVTHDPILARMRSHLRKDHGAARAGRKMGIACVYSREPVAAPDPSCSQASDGTLNCHGYGSVVSVTATFGMCAAGWIMESIGNGQGRPANQ